MYRVGHALYNILYSDYTRVVSRISYFNRLCAIKVYVAYVAYVNIYVAGVPRIYIYI